MPVTFTPLSEPELQEVKRRALLQDGTYQFTVKQADEAMSQSGNQMIIIVVSILDAEGKERTLKDYLLFNEEMLYKTRHFCDAVGLIESYARGHFSAHEFVGRSGRCTVGIQKGRTKPDGSVYDDKNMIKDYLKRDAHAKPAVSVTAEFINDDVGF
jgi:hypothetical protein